MSNHYALVDDATVSLVLEILDDGFAPTVLADALSRRARELYLGGECWLGVAPPEKDEDA